MRDRRQPLDRNIEGLRGELQMFTLQLVSFKQMVHQVSESNSRTARRMSVLTWVIAAMTAGILILTVVLVADALAS